MKHFINTLIALLFLLVLSDEYAIRKFQVSYCLHSIYFMIVLIYLLKTNNKITWAILFIICLYGCYNMWAIDLIAAEPTFMDITSGLYVILKSYTTNRLTLDITGTIPFYCYGLFLLLLFTIPFRQYFRFKIPSLNEKWVD